MSNKRFDFNKSGKSSFAPKKEKPVKVKKIKEPKAPKPAKVKTPKAFKELKSPKGPKPVKEKKIKSFKASNTANTGFSIKPENPKKKKIIIIISVVAVLIIALAVAVTVVVVNAKKQGQEINYISVSSTPNKMSYYVGEEADYKGLIINVTRKNGETFTVLSSECVIKGFDSSAATEKQRITVNYEGFIATFTIRIEELPKPTPILVGIHFEQLPKTEYKVGEWLDTSSGMLVREYKDGSTKRITLVNSYVYGWEEAYEAGPGTYTLTVTYVENGIPAVTHYPIKILPAEASE